MKKRENVLGKHTRSSGSSFAASASTNAHAGEQAVIAFATKDAAWYAARRTGRKFLRKIL